MNNIDDQDQVTCPHCGEVTHIGGLIGEHTNDCPRCGKQALTQEPPMNYFTKAQAIMLAFQNTADDGEWTYEAEKCSGSDYYLVVIYGEDGTRIGTL